MATITGLTAERMLEIEGASVVDGEVVGGNLILTQHDGTQINAGSVVGPQGPQGPVGPAAISAIPGEVKLWPNSVLPNQTEYGKWVWADGAVYVVATYPKAAGNIATQWRTFSGASDPGAANFRVPDLRGLVPAGMDAMPGGSRANRMTRSVAIVIAGRAGEEQHVVTINEMPYHGHGGGYHDHGGGWHGHGIDAMTRIGGDPENGGFGYGSPARSGTISPNWAGLTPQSVITAEGGNGAHENVQPTVFIPYIVKLDD